MEMRSMRSRELGRRPMVGRMLVVAVAALAVLPAAGRGLSGQPGGRAGRPGSRPVMYVGGDTAPGQITAQNGKFWVAGQQVKLRGVNVTPTWDCAEPTDADFAQIASWGMNFVRLQVRWKFIENPPPTPSGSSWIHYYDDDYIACLQQMVGWAYN